MHKLFIFCAFTLLGMHINAAEHHQTAEDIALETIRTDPENVFSIRLTLKHLKAPAQKGDHFLHAWLDAIIERGLHGVPTDSLQALYDSEHVDPTICFYLENGELHRKASFRERLEKLKRETKIICKDALTLTNQWEQLHER